MSRGGNPNIGGDTGGGGRPEKECPVPGCEEMTGDVPGHIRREHDA